MYKIKILIVGGVLIPVLVVCPVVEKVPLPHTVETSYSATPVPSLVIPFSGSNVPVNFNHYTGSWG
jgi:hypothetical protein